MTTSDKPQWLIGKWYANTGDDDTIAYIEAVFEASDLERGNVTYVAFREDTGGVTLVPLSLLIDGQWFEDRNSAEAYLKQSREQ